MLFGSVVQGWKQIAFCEIGRVLMPRVKRENTGRASIGVLKKSALAQRIVINWADVVEPHRRCVVSWVISRRQEGFIIICVFCILARSCGFAYVLPGFWIYGPFDVDGKHARTGGGAGEIRSLAYVGL